MRRPSIYHERRQQLDVKMTPMIDVVFLLLVFFVWTASFQIVERLLPSGLLNATGTGNQQEIDNELADFDVIVVRLDWQQNQPTWMVNGGRQESLTDVEGMLAAVARVRSDVPVVVDPAAAVPLGHVIDVYDITRRLGFGTIQFAAADES